MKLKILKGLAAEAIFLREEREKYRTNRKIKAIGLWVLLKNLTTSGIINHPEKQAGNLCALSKCSWKTMQRWQAVAEELGLIRRVDGVGWSLTSWDKACEIFILNKHFLTIEYDETDQKQSLEYVLKALEIAENQERQLNAYQVKKAQNPHINAAILMECKHYGIGLDGRSPQDHFAMQKLTFGRGGSLNTYQAIHSLNPDFQRSAKRIAAAHRYKSPISITYLKRQLELRGLARVTKREAVICNYRINPSDHIEVRGNKKTGYRRYDTTEKTAKWYLPDQIQPKIQWQNL